MNLQHNAHYLRMWAECLMGWRPLEDILVGQNMCTLRLYNMKSFLRLFTLTNSDFWITNLDLNPFLAWTFSWHIKAKLNNDKSWYFINISDPKLPFFDLWIFQPPLHCEKMTVDYFETSFSILDVRNVGKNGVKFRQQWR